MRRAPAPCSSMSSEQAKLPPAHIIETRTRPDQAVQSTKLCTRSQKSTEKAASTLRNLLQRKLLWRPDTPAVAAPPTQHQRGADSTLACSDLGPLWALHCLRGPHQHPPPERHILHGASCESTPQRRKNPSWSAKEISQLHSGRAHHDSRRVLDVLPPGCSDGGTKMDYCGHTSQKPLMTQHPKERKSAPAARAP
ncbi:unnamed protein product [Pleuronectes platessa]|uniref:Uncharacterized protein n=1 Tax=Pleuronectes platessa TaxID=8262 RepID=A0A9N7YPR0_PLEPL|nr:unnamed protein product [Pleuronectes platessa]